MSNSERAGEAGLDLVASFDLKNPPADFLDNPYPLYHLLRQHDPVHLCPDGTYFLTRYDDLAQAYKDQRLSSDKKVEFKPKFGDGALYTHHTTSLVFNDPPLHTRVRHLISGALTPRALKALEPRLAALIDRLLDRAEDHVEIDLVEDFAAAIPIEVIGDLLGVPHADRGPLRDWSLAILGALEPVITPEQRATGDRAVTDFRDYLKILVAARRQQPGDVESDVLSRLIAGEADGSRLTEEELLQNCIFLLNAGHETTTNLIGNGIAALIEWRDQEALLREKPDLIKLAVEEFLRFESSNQLGNRLATTEIRFGAVTLPPGSLITLCIGAANRDPAQFPNPDTLDISRTPNRHLAFGGGIHACAGMSLARMEGQIAIGRLIQRFSKVDPAGPFKRGGRARFRGFLSYPLRLKP